MAAEALEHTPDATPRDRLWREFAARAATDHGAWHARTWARAVLMRPGDGDEAVVALLSAEWAAYRRRHPHEPEVAFHAPAPRAPDETVRPGPPPYGALPPLVHGRYGVDLPSHEDRVREEQERLARRDTAFYGF